MKKLAKSKIQALIIEDEIHSYAVLEEMLPLVNDEVKIVGHAKSVKEGIREIETKRPDLVFLDVILSDGNGFDVLKAFPQPWFRTIFTTSYKTYALNAIKHAPIDYLLKPISPKSLKEAMVKTNKWYHDQLETNAIRNFYAEYINDEESIVITDGNQYRLSSYNEIMCIEADNHYSNVHYVDGMSILSSEPLSGFESNIPDYLFRIHKSYIINLNKVVSYQVKKQLSVKLCNGMEIPIAHRRKPEFLDRLKK